MAFRPRWAAEATQQFEKLKDAASKSAAKRAKDGKSKSSKSEGLFKQVEKCVRLLLEDPRHPGLQTHEFVSIEHPFDPHEKVFEAYVQHRTPGAYRLFWCHGPKQGEITILAITPHP